MGAHMKWRTDNEMLGDFNRELVKFVRGLDLLRLKVFRDLDLPKMSVLLEVAKHDDEGGVTQDDLSKITQLPRFTISRCIKNLSTYREGNEEKGLGLLESEADLLNHRTYRVTLSKKGRKVVRDLCKALAK